MSYLPKFSISPALLLEAEQIAALRERIASTVGNHAGLAPLQKDCCIRNAHASTAIEGNPVSLEQVRVLAEGRQLAKLEPRAQREVSNYLAGLRYAQKNADKNQIRQTDILALQEILAGGVMHQGKAGAYRSSLVQAGEHVAPPPSAVIGLMLELLGWWNKEAPGLSPIISSAILHYRFEAIHPFADGNGRVGRVLGLWELYRRGFDALYIIPLDEYFAQDRPRYYAALQEVRDTDDDLSAWLEYYAEGVHMSLQQAWIRIQALQGESSQKLVLRPRQEQLLHLLRDQGGMAPSQIWAELSISRQGAMDLLRPLLDAGVVEKVGGNKTGRYVLKQLN